ncbi:MAG: PEGA domain-containing protein [Lachnospiraceae bacterium]|jgi:hypothetical protein|nr:PEGA domain-containing protein [Lachnospiraceae bacterium]
MSNSSRKGPGENKRGSGHDYEDEGVYYTPSKSSRRRQQDLDKTRIHPAMDETRIHPPVKRRQPVSKSSRSASPEKSRPTGGNYVYFYIITLVVAVIVCIAVFFAAFKYVTKGEAPPAKQEPGTSQEKNTDEKSPVAAVDETSIIGLINKVDSSGNKVEIFDIENKKTFDFSISGTTQLKNKYGEAIVFAEIKVGDIVDARFSSDSKELSGLSISSMAWEHKLVTNVKINTENQSIVIGNDTYKYDKDKTMVFYEGSAYDISKIDPLNVVTLKGMNDTCWYVEVNTAVGTIEVKNGQNIKDGIIEIDNNSRILMEEGGSVSEPIKVQEGKRKLVIKGSNIEPMTKEIEVKSGEIAVLDLSDAVITSGTLNIVINVTGAKVMLDDKQINAEAPQNLPYGEYTVKAEKDGYEPYEVKVNIDAPTKEVNITLNELVKTREINITTVPAGADIYVDNAYMGISPLSINVDENASSLSVRKDGYINVNLNMSDVEKNTQIILREDMSNPPTETAPIIPTP